MPAVSPQGNINDSGFTVLQDGGDNPEVDIIFVHGLQGHPQKTWSAVKKEYTDATTRKESKQEKTTFLGFLQRLSGAKEIHADCKEEPESIFWPRDLLPQDESCASARIMTYGYDSSIIRFVDTVNFSTISGQAETLLNAVTRIRQKCQRRPLIFITHSLGGPIVKAALNSSCKNNASDLHAVEQSVFAIIFFGAPHCGSPMAGFCNKIAHAMSILTMKPYNKNILRALDENSEILRQIRREFWITEKDMVKRNHFESSTFQEDKAATGIPGFQCKIVEDDSSEDGINHRYDHINRNHMDICKFDGADDPEYEKVLGEIQRHLARVQKQVDEESNNLLMSLKEYGVSATLMMEQIETRTDETLRWLYTARAYRNGAASSQGDKACTLASWLEGQGPQSVFWITGKPGSGKSTATKHLVDQRQTIDHLRKLPLAKGKRLGVEDDWCLIPAFITNRGSDEQRSWDPMLYNILRELLIKFPALARTVTPLVRKKKIKRFPTNTVPCDHNQDIEVYEWTRREAEEILIYCKSQDHVPFRALIVIDGLDELEDLATADDAIAFLKTLAKPSPFGNIIKVCVSSRAEQGLRDLFIGCLYLEIHENTKVDIRQHALACFCRNPRFHGQSHRKIEKQVKHLLDYVCENADGVFLWASAIVAEANEMLRCRKPMAEVLPKLKCLPKSMDELYCLLLKRINTSSRSKAYIMLEVILRARVPMTVLELFLITHVTERYIAGKQDLWADRSTVDVLEGKDFLDASRLQGELIDCCKCFLEISSRSGYQRPGYALEDEEETNYRLYPSSDLQIDSGLAYPKPNLARRLRDEIFASPRILGGKGKDSRLRSIRDQAQLAKADIGPANKLMDRWLSKDIIDPTRDVVQLLHGSAKDFLLGDNSLNMLFDSPEKKIKGNGHSYILLFAKAWLQLTQHQRKRLNCPFDVIMEVPFHAAQLESTLSTKDSALFFQTLDNIDHQLSTSHRGEQWPAEWFSRTVRNDIPSWNFTFRAFAVSMDMQGYIGYRLEQARNNHGQADFLNPKHGRPLLHFAVYLSGQPPKPEMTRMLLKSGADIKAQFDDKTAIQSMLLKECDRMGNPHLKIIYQLISYGADPNSRYSPDTSYPNVWYPLLHIVAHLDDTIDLEARLDFMTFMCHAQGIDLNALDVAGRTLAEVLYWEDKTIPPQNWEILLGSGAKITKNMVSVHFHGLRYWEPGLETPQEISDNDHKSTESPEDESEQQSENRSDTGSTSSRTESEHRQLSLRLSAEHLSPDDCIIIASHARNYPSDAWKQTCTPTTSKKRKLRGLCEGYSHHNAYQVLRKPEFRRREWYTPEAAKAAEEIDPCWFLDYGRTHPKLNPIRTQSIMGSVLGPISEFIIGSFGT